MRIDGVTKFQINKISSSGNVWGEAVDEDVSGVCLGPLDCKKGDEINAVLIINKDMTPYKCGICIDTSLWTEEYESRLVGMFDRSSGNRGNIQIIIDEIKSGDFEEESDSDVNKKESSERPLSLEKSSESLKIGNAYTQKEIEEAFNTGFGYRISGINPRRDEHDQRYILLFANEEGPYNDSVTQGRFEYIGEGLSGDQSEDSPGNSALIDARTSNIPIHFFYKRGDEPDWEYQGQVDVIDYEFREQDGRSVLVFTIEHQPQDGTYDLNETPDIGKTFTAKIDRVSDSGNGIVETPEGDINIGPVYEQSVGIEIKATRVRGQAAFCKTDRVTIENYGEQFRKRAPINSINWSQLDKGDVITVVLLKISSSGNGIIDHTDGKYVINIGPVTKDAVGTAIDIEKIDTQFGFCKTESVRGENYIQRHPVDFDDEIYEVKNGENRIIDSRKSGDSVAEVEETKENIKETRKNEAQDGEEKHRTDSPTDNETEANDVKKEDVIDQLRKQAAEEAVEEVPEEASTVQHETPTYNRSQAVKEYVKARADGVCEGCGEPAPFISKTGEPYLHAHHIHELSNGGSDTSDTVVALCPNCHYRVHHGEDGDEYNQELLEIVQEKENSVE